MADHASETTQELSSDTPAKKPYAAPVLLHWGTFSELTQQNNHSSTKDSGRGGSRGTN
jgi:hypothetical protein